MLLVALNAAFALIFFTFARNALKRGWPFLKTGWDGISVEVQKPDFRHNVESRRKISESTNFLFGGVFWLGSGVVAIGFGVFFTIQLINLYL